MKILLAVDGSPYSDAAVDEVMHRPWPAHSEVKVITASETPTLVGMEPWVVLPQYFEEMEKSFREAAESINKASVLKLKTSHNSAMKISSEIIRGLPAEVIVDEAERWGADLIVMGSRGLGVWNRLLLGSVSSAVVHHARCSVEIVRRPEDK